MLKPAQLYEDRLNYCLIDNWYNPENIYWNFNCGDYEPEIPANNHDSHDFVSVNEFGRVYGYICYDTDWEAMSCNDLGIISFDKGNPIFAKDVYQAIYNIFNLYHMNRLQWMCYADNPTLKSYRYFIKHYGGHEVGYYKQCRKLRDGKLHDLILFELMADEFKGKPPRRKSEVE